MADIAKKQLFEAWAKFIENHDKEELQEIIKQMAKKGDLGGGAGGGSRSSKDIYNDPTYLKMLEKARKESGLKGAAAVERQYQIAKHGTTGKYETILSYFGISPDLLGENFKKKGEQKASQQQIDEAKKIFGLDDETLKKKEEERQAKQDAKEKARLEKAESKEKAKKSIQEIFEIKKIVESTKKIIENINKAIFTKKGFKAEISKTGELRYRNEATGKYTKEKDASSIYMDSKKIKKGDKISNIGVAPPSEKASDLEVSFFDKTDPQAEIAKNLKGILKALGNDESKTINEKLDDIIEKLDNVSGGSNLAGDAAERAAEEAAKKAAAKKAEQAAAKKAAQETAKRAVQTGAAEAATAAEGGAAAGTAAEGGAATAASTGLAAVLAAGAAAIATTGAIFYGLDKDQRDRAQKTLEKIADSSEQDIATAFMNGYHADYTRSQLYKMAENNTTLLEKLHKADAIVVKNGGVPPGAPPSYVEKLKKQAAQESKSPEVSSPSATPAAEPAPAAPAPAQPELQEVQVTAQKISTPEPQEVQVTAQKITKQTPPALTDSKPVDTPVSATPSKTPSTTAVDPTKSDVLPPGSDVRIGNEIRRGGTVSWRTNNPGNNILSNISKQLGAIGALKAKDGEPVAIMPTLDAGFQLQMNQWRRPKYNNVSIGEGVKMWTGGNQPPDSTYARDLAKAAGATTDTLVSKLSDDQLKSMVAKQAHWEGFKEGVTVSAKYGGIASGPESGYPAVLHGNEMIVPLHQDSLLSRIGNRTEQELAASQNALGLEMMSQTRLFQDSEMVARNTQKSPIVVNNMPAQKSKQAPPQPTILPEAKTRNDESSFTRALARDFSHPTAFTTVGTV